MDDKDLDGQQPNAEVATPAETAQPTAIERSTLETPEVTSPNKKKSKKLLIIIILTIVLSLAVGAGAMYMLTKESTNSETSTSDNQQSATDTEQVPSDNELAKFLEPKTGEVWYDESIEIPSKGWLTQESSEYIAPIKYYEIGTREENKIIITAVEELGTYIEFYELSPNGEVRLIKNVSSTAMPRDELQQDIFVDSVIIDEDIHYDSLSIPTDGLKLESGYQIYGPELMIADKSSEPGDGITVSEELTTTEGKVVKFEATYEEPGLTKIWFQYNINPGYTFRLVYEPFNTDENSIVWQSGDDKVDAKYSPIVRGCGGGAGVSKAFRIQDSDLKLAGTNDKGQDVYELVDYNYKLLTKAVEEYNEFNSYTEGFQAIVKQTMVDKHGVIFYKDSVGNWLVYTRDDLSPSAGCAKPVVYLYPETTTNVKVKVGADVKISDPLYPKNGWDVIAQPNGNLTVDGQSYASLFWEGPGRGQYPGINSGKIVPTKDAIATIKSQLSTLGLNKTEISDFVEYWQGKLPNKPYTRLTWLTTRQLDQLAPLFISPKPDTVIRVFLDYSGLDEPYDLPEQTLTSIPRTGFTVVEWGGLSPYKLY